MKTFFLPPSVPNQFTFDNCFLFKSIQRNTIYDLKVFKVTMQSVLWYQGGLIFFDQLKAEKAI